MLQWYRITAVNKYSTYNGIKYLDGIFTGDLQKSSYCSFSIDIYTFSRVFNVKMIRKRPPMIVVFFASTVLRSTVFGSVLQRNTLFRNFHWTEILLNRFRLFHFCVVSKPVFFKRKCRTEWDKMLLWGLLQLDLWIMHKNAKIIADIYSL